MAAVHDAAAATLLIYVNGQLAGTAPYTATPWHATGSFTAGRALRGGAAAEWFPGDIDDVRVYQGALGGDAVAGLSSM